jgi:hypothetical protein
MSPGAFALLLGIIFGLIGLGGLVPGLTHPIDADAPPLLVSEGYGLVLGVVPVNAIANLSHLAFGVLGVAAWNAWFAPVTYARLVTVTFTLVTMMGIAPGLGTAFGLAPLYGAAAVFHAALAASAAIYAFPWRTPTLRARLTS